MPTTSSGTINFAVVNATAATNDIVAATTGKSIVVLSAVLSMTGTTPTFKFQDDTPTVISGTWDVVGIYSMVGTQSCPLMSTAAGKKLQIATTGTASIRGHISYILSDR